MKWCRSNGRVLTLMMALAFFNFIFLGIEYQFDNMMAMVTGPEQVVTAQGYVLGASVLGFLLYPVAVSCIKEKFWQNVVVAGALAGVICIFVIWQHNSYGTILVAGCICFVLMGMAGSAVHYYLPREAEPEHLAKAVGISYAVGILLQFLNNNLIKNDTAESVALAVSAAVFSVLLLNAENGMSEAESTSESSGHVGFWLILLVILITCIFSTLDAVVTLGHVSGSADVGQWPRLLLAGSGLLAGVFFDGRKRRYGNILMYCVTVLSVLCIVVLENGGPFFAGLIVFYLSAGFFVVFFTVSFMRLSTRMKCPKLWAGLGRAVNNICAFATGSLSLRLILSENQMLRDGILLVLFVLISIAFFIYSNALYMQEKKEPESSGTKPGEEESLEMFAVSFSLTEREKEVLEVLLVSDENVQDIAKTLMISRAALYRHIASLNEKTGTKSRIGLVQFYYQYHRRNGG
ncbi:LuxR C-terminal-related transcriptional regulator [Agathobacter sp.]|uniref:LuxR C-terminal-related transcriptional regulator n=1 Tax=Agathobacter sp. TaxID=2021311 RepID=UPI003FD7DD17